MEHNSYTCYMSSSGGAWNQINITFYDAISQPRMRTHVLVDIAAAIFAFHLRTCAEIERRRTTPPSSDWKYRNLKCRVFITLTSHEIRICLENCFKGYQSRSPRNVVTKYVILWLVFCPRTKLPPFFVGLRKIYKYRWNEKKKYPAPVNWGGEEK